MSNLNVVIVKKDTRALDELIDRLANRWLGSANLRRFIADDFEDIMQEGAARRFDTESSEDNGAWEQLRVATQIFRARAGFPPAHPINERTGEMKHYLTSQTGTVTLRSGVDSMSGDWPSKPSGELLEKLSTAASGKRGQNGFADTPAREVVWATEGQLDDLAERFADDMERFV